jgi:predicted nucleotidyltransferase
MLDDPVDGLSILPEAQGGSMTRLSRPLAHLERIGQRRSRALERAEVACLYLISLGAREAYVFGSVLGERFRDHSDIDLAVFGLPEEYIYKIEGKIEELLEGAPFDLIYLEEAPPHIARRIREEGKRYAVGLC